ncbi:hypothetical protein NEMIN01_0702 [Nematocida minor]|uniref:uncharacterized protein n=1 Tax=Nematocida minor TaxID=1912983 RepID=UPI00221F48D6|nr:uncharacterized protein NEMIN01_0702 [Nematocida minor]KAI5189839.1 hypothetical protein NEMIN01_0702 [Nematocida minor]
MNHRIIEIKKLRGEVKIVKAEADQVVYIADIIESQVYIKGKCIKVVAIDIQRSFIGIKKATATVEIARAKNSLFLLENIPMSILEQCVECRIGTAAKNTEFRIRRSTCLSLVSLEDAEIEDKTPEEIDEICRTKKEEQLPDEIQVLLENGEIKSSISKNI